MIKRILIFFVILILNINLIFANNIDNNILKNLIDNKYFKTAAEICKNEKLRTNLCFYIYLKEKKYKEILNSISLNSTNPDSLLILLKASIRLKKYDYCQEIINRLNDLILSNEQEKRLTQLIILMNASIYYDNYEYREAMINFEKLKKLEKEDIEKLFLIYIDLDKIKKANSLIKKYKIKDPFFLGLIQYKQQNYNQALLLLKSSSNPYAKEYIYNCLILLGKLDDAKKYYKKTENFKKNFFSRIKLLINYEKFEEALYRLNNAENCYEKFFYTGLIYYKLNYYDKALDFFKKAANLNPTSEIFYYLGLVNFYNNNYMDAINYFQKVIISQDNLKFYTRSLYYQGIMFGRIGEFDKAEKNFQLLLNSINSYVNLTEIYKNYAIVAERKGDYVKAIKLYNNLYGLTKDKSILLKIANDAVRLGDYDYAVKVYGNFLPIKSKKDSFILKKIANIYMRAGNFKESIKFYKRYLKFYRKYNFKILLKVGLCYLYSNDLKNAKEYFLKIVELDKVSKCRNEALYWLGLIYYKEKNYLKSNIYFQRLYNSNPNSYLTHQAVSFILKNSIKLKDYDTFKKFAKIFPEEVDLNEIKNFCNTKDCLEILLIQPENEVKYKFFKKFYSIIKSQKIFKLESLINRYEEVFKKDPLVYFKIAEELKKNKHINFAIFYYNKFLSFPYRSVYYPEVEKTIKFLIDYYVRNKDFEKIIFLEDKFKNITPKNYYNFIMGESFYKTGLFLKSFLYLKKYIDNFTFPQDSLSNLFKASFILDNINKYKEALKGYKKFLKLSKNKKKNVEALYWIGEILYKENKKIKALKYFLRIRFNFKEYSKWNIQAAFRAGNIMEELGNIKDAIKEYKYIYYRLNNDDPRKIYIKKKLQKIKKTR